MREFWRKDWGSGQGEEGERGSTLLKSFKLGLETISLDIKR